MKHTATGLHTQQATTIDILSNSGQDTGNIILHHLDSFRENDLDAVVADYTHDSVLITPETSYAGLLEIRSFFNGLVVHFPRQETNFQLNKLTVSGELAYIVWQAKTPTLDVPMATDTFLVKDGKIHRQTFAGQLNYTS